MLKLQHSCQVLKRTLTIDGVDQIAAFLKDTDFLTLLLLISVLCACIMQIPKQASCLFSHESYYYDNVIVK